jgi:hypothetical protein
VLDWELVENLPSTEDLNRLRHQAGWNVCDEKATERGLAGSLFGVCAVAGGEKGADLVVCLAVNDPFVMKAWGEANEAEG